MHFKQQPSYAQDGITEPWQELPAEMQRGIKLAAYICRMYDKGEPWAEAIESKSEQIRAMWWMAKEKMS